MRAWLRQHRFALSDALGRIARHPGSFFFNMLVVAIALTLPFTGLTVLENIRPVSRQLAVEPEISIFMALDTPREHATALAQNIRRILQDSHVSGKLEFVPRENALGMLRDKTGLSDALTTLGSNPLPDGYVLRLSSFNDASEAAKVETIAARIKALPGVEYVQVDSAWVKRLAAIMNAARLALLVVAMSLGAVVVAVVFNTVRLQVMTQREEIEMARLVGATDAFIRRPFYYGGALLGLCAGALALTLAGLLLLPMNAAIAEIARLYASRFQLVALDAANVLLLLGCSALLGLIGALLSVRRHLAGFR